MKSLEKNNDEIIDAEQKAIEKEKAKKRHRRYLKLNLFTLFFTAVSFISVTLAWFAYSGLATGQTEVDVKAWYIQFSKDGKDVSDEIAISFDSIYPGMDIVSEKIDIKNQGDSDAVISYKISSVRILDEVYNIEDSSLVEDKLSNAYPFHINMSLASNYANSKLGNSDFSVSISWPLESGDNENDTLWGNKAYEFQKSEADKLKNDSNYQVRHAIEIKISLEAVQYIGDGTSPDPDYSLGKVILYDVVQNKVCNEIGGTCIKSYVIDKNNKQSDSIVNLLPDLRNNYVNGEACLDDDCFDSYVVGSDDDNTDNAFNGLYIDYDRFLDDVDHKWKVSLRKLSVSDVLGIVSKDVNKTVMTGDYVSDQIVGYIDYGNRIDDKISWVISKNGMFRFNNSLFNYFSTSDCYWLAENYSNENGFALVNIDNSHTKIYPENKANVCKFVPVIEASKVNLE